MNHATYGVTPPTVCACGKPVHDGTTWTYRAPASRDELLAKRARAFHSARQAPQGSAERRAHLARAGHLSRKVRDMGEAPDPFTAPVTPITKLRMIADRLMTRDPADNFGPCIVVEVSKTMNRLSTVQRELTAERAKLDRLRVYLDASAEYGDELDADDIRHLLTTERTPA